MKNWTTFESFNDAADAARKLAVDSNKVVSVTSGYIREEIVDYCSFCDPDGTLGPDPGGKPVWFVTWSGPKDTAGKPRAPDRDAIRNPRVTPQVREKIGAEQIRQKYRATSGLRKQQENTKSVTPWSDWTTHDYRPNTATPDMADSEIELIAEELWSDREEFARSEEDGWPYADDEE